MTVDRRTLSPTTRNRNSAGWLAICLHNGFACLRPPRPRLDRVSLHLFAGLRVRDFQAARSWYERLLGEPTFFPHAREAVWTLAEDRSVYVVEHPDGAGNSVLTIFLGDLDERVAAIAARGLEPDERETYSNGVRKVLYRDPDGNELGFGGAPPDDAQ